MRTRGDLNNAEAANILKRRRAIRSPQLDDVTDDLWLPRLHKLMFGDVWPWAGTDRLTERNIGIDWVEVSAAVRALGVDCRTWIVFDTTEVPVARFHHVSYQSTLFPTATVHTPSPRPTTCAAPST